MSTFWSTMEQASCFTCANSEAVGSSTNSRVKPIWMWKETPGPGGGPVGCSGAGESSSYPPSGGGGDPGPGEPGSAAGWNEAAAMRGDPGPAARRPPGTRLQGPTLEATRRALRDGAVKACREGGWGNYGIAWTGCSGTEGITRDRESKDRSRIEWITQDRKRVREPSDGEIARKQRRVSGGPQV